MPIETHTIQAPPGTDLWSKPSDPPVLATNHAARSYAIKLEDFRYAQVSVIANWTRLYDQGGFVLSFGDDSPKRWIKSGVEFYNDIVNVSTVATPEWSDWSLLPLPSIAKGAPVTIRLEREIKNGVPGPSLWVYYIDPAGAKLAIREVTWVSKSRVALTERQC
ncbi:hypothetical protein FRC02_011364 [Tulasnella sp. 418]|nr:hypothetical protein FRC02_011364 [Tulasnella sp. 418]